MRKTLNIVLALVMVLSFSFANVKTTNAASASFIWPTDGDVTSEFAPRWGSFHYGIDIAASGTVPVKASAAGKVVRSGWSDSYGWVVVIDHYIADQQYQTLYAHMREKPAVSYGQTVSQNKFLGYQGNTGDSKGQHLHFEVHKGEWNSAKSNAINPREVLDKTLESNEPDLDHVDETSGIGYMIADQDTKIYDAPSSSAGVVRDIPKGKAFYVYTVSDNNFLRVSEGMYVNKAHVSYYPHNGVYQVEDERVESANHDSGTGYMVAKKSTKILKSPSSSASKVKDVNPGKGYYVYALNGDYYKVSTNMYIHKDNIAYFKHPVHQVDDNRILSINKDKGIGYMIAKHDLTVYSEPSTSSSTVKQAGSGQGYTVYAVNGDFLRVSEGMYVKESEAFYYSHPGVHQFDDSRLDTVNTDAGIGYMFAKHDLNVYSEPKAGATVVKTAGSGQGYHVYATHGDYYRVSKGMYVKKDEAGYFTHPGVYQLDETKLEDVNPSSGIGYMIATEDTVIIDTPDANGDWVRDVPAGKGYYVYGIDGNYVKVSTGMYINMDTVSYYSHDEWQ